MKMCLKQMRSKIFGILMVTLMCLAMLTGCGGVNENSDIYTHIQEQTNTFRQNTGQAKVDSWTYITEGIYKAANACKKGVPFVCIISIAIGVLIRHIVQEDTAIRKKGWIFIIWIPVISIVFTIGLAIMVQTFL